MLEGPGPSLDKMSLCYPETLASENEIESYEFCGYFYNIGLSILTLKFPSVTHIEIMMGAGAHESVSSHLLEVISDGFISLTSNIQMTFFVSLVLGTTS